MNQQVIFRELSNIVSQCLSHRTLAQKVCNFLSVQQGNTTLETVILTHMYFKSGGNTTGTKGKSRFQKFLSLK